MDRTRNTSFPERREDWIGEDNPVRTVEVFVDGSICQGWALAAKAGRNREEMRRVPFGAF